MNVTQLREQIERLFSLEELRTLCFDLGVDYDSLPGEGKAAKARELVMWMERRGRLAELAQHCARLRPNVDWGMRPDRSSRPVRSEGSEALEMARRALAILEQQAAAYTALTIPVHLKIELEEKRREVAELEQRATHL